MAERRSKRRWPWTATTRRRRRPDVAGVHGNAKPHKKWLAFELFEPRHLLAGGALDPIFGVNGVASVPSADHGNAVAVQPDGKIVVAASNGLSSGESGITVARFNPDGSLDTTFGTAGVAIFGNANEIDAAHAIAIEPDGNILVTASAYAVNGGAVGGLIVQFNPDGSLNTQFGSGGELESASVDAGNLVVESNGEFYAGSQTITRYDEDGSIDPTFTAANLTYTYNGQPAVDQIVWNSLSIDSAGRLLAVGTGVDPDGGRHFAAARFQLDGKLDKSFNGTGYIDEYLDNPQYGWFGGDGIAAAIEPDGTILVNGSFNFPSKGFTGAGLLKLNVDGSIDTAFGNSGLVSGANPGPISIAPNGNIIVWDSYTLQAYLPNGAADPLFGDNGAFGLSEFEATLNSNIAFDADGNIYVVGPDYEPTPTSAFYVERRLWNLVPLVPTAVASYATEGVSAAQPVAEFTDPNGPTALGRYSATIDWGDGTTPTLGTVSGPDANGVFDVTGVHSYADEQITPHAVAVVVSRAGAPDATVTATVTVNDAPLTAGTASATTGTEGAAYNTVPSVLTATFIDANAGAPTSDFSGTIDWGDGTSASPDITTFTSENVLQRAGSDGSIGTYTIGASHFYAEEGTYPLTIVVNDVGGSTATIRGTATVADAALALRSASATAGTEGVATSTLTATFTDANSNAPTSDFGGTIDWGDGTSSSPDITTVTSSDVSSSAGIYTLTASHLYADEGSYPITLIVKDLGGSTGTITTAVGVQDAALTAGTASATTGTEGVATSTLTATFADTNGGAPTSDFSGTINWGDGTPSNPDVTPFASSNVTGAAGSYAIGAAHLYPEDGHYPITIIVKDAGGNTVTIGGTATVKDAALTAGTASATTGTEGVAASTLTATFTDANSSAPTSDFSGTINWGDGTSSNPDVTTFTSSNVTGGAGSYTIGASHLYAEDGSYSITIVVNDAGGNTVTLGATASVKDATLTGGTASPTTGTEGVAMSTLTATFTDANTGAPTSDFSGTINWGDGTSSNPDVTTFTSGNVTGSAGSYTIGASHLYAEDGSYPITIVVNDAAGSTATIGGTATVNDAAMTAGTVSATTGTEGVVTNTLTATFTDANTGSPISDFSGTINWGDGTPSNPDVTTFASSNVTGGAGSYAIGAAHLYPEDGSYPITIVVKDAGNNTVTIGGTATVKDGAMAAGTASATTGTEGVATSTLTATFTDANAGAPASDFSGTINWGDGAPSNPDTTTFTSSNVTGGAGGYTIGAAHLYAEEGNYPIAIAVKDIGGSTVTINGTAAPVDAPLTARTLTPPVATEGEAFGPTMVLHFTDADSNATTGDFTATVDTGDATLTSAANPQQVAIAAASGGGFDVELSYTYPQQLSDKMFAVSVADKGGAQATSSAASFAVADQPLVATAQPISAQAGTELSGTIATFIDPGGAQPLADYSATVDWGDGSAVEPAIVGGPDGNGIFTVSGSHTYNAAGQSTATITVHHSGATPDVVVHDNVAVSGPVSYSSSGGNISVTAVNGNLEILAGTSVVSSTPLTDVTSVSVNGANGVANNFTLDYSGGTFVVPGGITFNGGALPATPSNSLTIAGGNFDTDTFNFSTSHNGSIQLGTGGQVVNYTNMTPLANTGTAANAVFKLPDGTVVATLDAAGSGMVQLVSGNGSFETTTFAAPAGSLTINSGNGSDTVTPTASFYNNFTAGLAVSGAANTLSLRGTAAGSLTATEGVELTHAVATFSDPNGAGAAGSYSATINWGDNTNGNTAAISGPDANGKFTVTGSHTYAEEQTAGATVTVVLQRSGVADVTVTDTVQLADAPLSGKPASVSATAQATFSGVVATVTDANPAATAADFTATIDWGDGTMGPGTVTSVSGGFQVSGSHAYATSGTEKIVVTVNDLGGQSATVTSSATVTAGGTPHEQYVAAVYEDVLGRTPDPNGLAFWAKLLDQGAAVSSVAEDIAHSAEYYADFVIAPAYLSLLGRAADANGTQFWVNQMQGGLTDQQLEAGFVASDEFYANAGGNDKAWVDAVYKLLLGRPADSAGEIYWTGQLAQGQTRLQVAERIAGSQENDTQLINADYQHYLGRPADAAGLDFWLQQFADGQTNEDVIAGFTGSAEYYDEHTR
jgi:uncharacterized delta-60 repeat protein